MEPSNGRRVVRALEVVTLTGAMPGEMTAYEAHYPTTYVGVDRDDLASGWPAGRTGCGTPAWSRRSGRSRGTGLRDGVTASRALGYAQVLAWLDGTLDDPRRRPSSRPGGS
jgi:tRNA dimethylallyltransferase